MSLAEDLVTAAAEAIRRRNMKPWRHPDAAQHRALQGQDAVVAVVHRVVTELRSDGATGSSDWRDAYTQAANDLEMLADEIEGDSRG